MAKTYNKMQIDMNGDILSSVTAVAQDTLSRYLDCNLYNNGVTLDLTGHMAQLYVTKPDETIVVTQGEITDAAAGRVQFELTNQTLAVTGWLDLQIVLTSGEGEVLSSEIFKLHVLPSIRSDEAIESTNEFGALVVLYQEIQNSLDLMKAIVDNFGEPSEIAEQYNATTFWQMLENVVGKVDVIAALKAYVNSTMGTDYFMPINKMISSISGTKDFVPLDLLIKALLGSSETFISDGTFVVPEGVYKIRVTIAGGGGGGSTRYLVGTGGGGAACIVMVFEVTPGENISVIIGVGGEGATNNAGDANRYDGEDGTASVFGNYVTAPGGFGGKHDAANNTTTAVGGESGGTGGGTGASRTYVSGNCTGDDKGEDGAIGTGGTSGERCGAGGGSYGDGGDGSDDGNGINGGYGAGGGAGREKGGNGGNGIVVIEWGAGIA